MNFDYNCNYFCLQMGNVWILKQKNNQVQWKQQFSLINHEVFQEKKKSK
jgi:hypothetical protein